MKKVVSIIFMFSFLSATAYAHCGECGSGDKKHSHDKNIVSVAQEAGSFTTLLQAAEAAGLVETLTGEGPYTVFAPTDTAFAKLPDGTVESLLNDPEKLKAILLYHVVPGRAMATDVVKKKSLSSAQGTDIEGGDVPGVGQEIFRRPGAVREGRVAVQVRPEDPLAILRNNHRVTGADDA